MKYVWAHAHMMGTHEDAQILGETLEAIERKGIALTPERLVEVASPPDSPIHHLFTWDDKDAADAWRRSEARKLIRHLEVVVDDRGREVKTRSFVSLTMEPSVPEAEPDKNNRHYVRVSDMHQDPVAREQVKQTALVQLRNWVARYKNLGFEEFAPVYELVEQMGK